MPGKNFLRKSLALWERRLAYRRQRVIAYRKRKAAESKRDGKVSPGTKWKLAMWERRYAYAGRMVRKRRQQLDGPKAKKNHQRPIPPSIPAARQKAIREARANLGWFESPAGSNRGAGITQAQRSFGEWLVGLAWCGVYVGVALRAAGVAITSRVASVAMIEDDAKAGRYGFLAWRGVKRQAIPGDVGVMFGRGVHTELIEEVHDWGCVTLGGNTSPENGGGSQSNGGGSYRRTRRWTEIYGVAVPRYPDN